MEDSPEKTLSRIRKELLDDSNGQTSSLPQSIQINGHGNIVGNGNVVLLWQEKEQRERPKVVVQTGVGVLDAAQKAAINELVYEWVDLSNSIRARKSEIAVKRAQFNRAMHVNSYAEIKQEDFSKAVAWLKRQIAILDGMASAPSKDPDWRTKRFRGINARAKEYPGGEARYRQYAFDHFGTSSLRGLNDEQLDAVYRHVFGWKK